MDWKGKVVLLTGASSGIGEALAQSLASRGATLGLLARRQELLEQLVQRCGELGSQALALPCDVTDHVSVRASADRLRSEFGPIDILIANAGIGGNDKATRELDPAAVKKVIDINLLGAVNSVGAVLPEMLRHKSGHLVAISSLAGFRGIPRSAAYSASKAGMNAFFESIRLDTAGTGVAVTIIQPGFIKTPLTAGRKSKMPFLMELDSAIPVMIKAMEQRRRFKAFPWPIATLVRSGQMFPAWFYDRIASRAKYRE